MSEAAAELLGYPVCFHLPFKVVIHDLDIKGALVSAFYLTPVLAGRGAVSRHVHKPQVGSAGCEEFLEIRLVVSESIGIPADGGSRIGIRTGREAPEKACMDSIPFRGHDGLVHCLPESPDLHEFSPLGTDFLGSDLVVLPAFDRLSAFLVLGENCRSGHKQH